MKINRFAGVATIVLASTQMPEAVPISGDIGITGSLTYDTGSSANATEEITWIAPQVVGASGDFALPSTFGISPGTPVAMSPLTWKFNTATPINSFWSVDGFTFELLSSYVAAQGVFNGTGFLDVDGTGLVSGNGFSATVMSFDLTSQDPIAGQSRGVDSWSFSASGATSSGVADGGSTVMLLGLALSGAAWMARKGGQVNVA
jgi:hypothetical protein